METKMKNINKLSLLILYGLIISIIIFLGCSQRERRGIENTNNIEESQKDYNDTPKIIEDEETVPERNLHTWAVYWDSKEIIKYINELNDGIVGLSYFAAYFNEEKEIFIPEAIYDVEKKIQAQYGEEGLLTYLSFVNDLQKEDGTSSLKDTELLYYLLSDSQKIQSHIRDIIKITEEHGFDGIEIDYEAIRNDMELWELFIEFIDELYKKATDNNLYLRIILEPSIPIENIQFPKGPEYIIMCYNLYGYGTAPGPKADKEFLIDIVDRFKGLPGEVGFSVASGGFEFSKAGSDIRAITTHEAILKQEGALATKEYRDKDSHSLVFSYMDEIGEEYEVWYADSTTLDHWCNILESKGVKKINLWRLGG